MSKRVGLGACVSLLLALLGGCGSQSTVRESEASTPGVPQMDGSAATDDAGDSSTCNYLDPSLRYVARGSCATIDWGCAIGAAFQNACGCGCTVPDGG